MLSSSRHADSTDSLDFLSLSVPIGHRSRQALSITSHVHTATECLFLLISHYLCPSVKSIRERCLRVRPYFTTNDQYVFFVLLGWFVRWEVSARIVILYFQKLFKTGRSILIFFPIVLLKFLWCNHTIDHTRLQLERIPVFFYRRGHIFIWSLNCQLLSMRY